MSTCIQQSDKAKAKPFAYRRDYDLDMASEFKHFVTISGDIPPEEADGSMAKLFLLNQDGESSHLRRSELLLFGGGSGGDMNLAYVDELDIPSHPLYSGRKRYRVEHLYDSEHRRRRKLY